ncbi:MAG: hypothetical protein HY921_07075 [Elusimicrobia bacterium]|nr:hypothetical protein [Elusimicrobiota bacterium]
MRIKAPYSLAALLLAVPALGQEQALVAEIARTRDLAGNRLVSDSMVAEQAFGLSHEDIPRARIAVEASLHPWDLSPYHGKPATVKDLMDSGRNALSQGPFAAPAELKAVMAYAEALFAQGRIRIDQDDELEREEMGVYKYDPSRRALGGILLNRALPFIAARAEPKYVFSTIIHEAAHALAHMEGLFDPKDTMANEAFAFSAQCLWLNFIDPGGRSLGTRHLSLAIDSKENPSELNSRSKGYAGTLDGLWGTRGDEKKIKDLLRDLGYQEGHNKRRPGLPPSA